MKLVNKQDSENSENSENSSEEELSADGKPESTENGAEESDDIDDNEDAIGETKQVTEVLQQISLGAANKKVILKKSKTKKATTQKLVDEAIQELNERKGSSTRAIRKYIMNKNPELVETRLKWHIKRYIANSVTDGTMVQIKRSFKFTKKHGMIAKQKQQEKSKAKTMEQEKKTTITGTITKKENASKKVVDETKTTNSDKTHAEKEPENKATKNSILKKDAKKNTKNKKKLSPKRPPKSVQPTSPHVQVSVGAATKKLKNSTRSEIASAAANAAAVQASRRPKKK